MKKVKAKMNDKKSGIIVGIGQDGDQEYIINSVKYIVSSSFLPFCQKQEPNMQERFKKVIESDFTHLQKINDSDTMKAENVCMTAGKED